MSAPTTWDRELSNRYQEGTFDDWVIETAWDHFGPGNLLYNNPWNLYSVTQPITTESVAAQIWWQAIPAGAFAAAWLSGAEIAGYVGSYSVPGVLGATAFAHLYIFGAVSAAAIVYDVHTNPESEAKLSSGLKITNTSNRDIMRMITLGPVS